MEEKNLKEMIERFFNAELSAEEERRLCRYLRDNDVPAELRKDKETVMALCSTDDDILLPEGADLRLEAMLDELETETVHYVGKQKTQPSEKYKLLKIPRYIIHSAVAAAVVVMAYMLYTVNESSVMDTASVVVAEVEEDTFDTPEEAMQCMKLAFKDMLLAVNATHMNAKEIGTEIKRSAIMKGGE